MKTIKIIDLLNKIAKGEELPNKIAYTPLDGCRYILKYDELKEDYYDGEDCLMGSAYNIIYHLNDEIEIIEEEKEIKEIKVTKDDNCKRYIEYDDETGHHKYVIRVLDEYFSKKINELVREIRKLKDKE